MSTQTSTQFPFDAALQLDDGLTAHGATGAGTVGGAAFVFDTMAGAPGGPGAPPVTDVIRYGAVAVVDATAVTGSDVVTIQGSNDPTFATGVQTLATVAVSAAGRNHAPFSNSAAGALQRYLRAYHTVTTGPVTTLVFLAPFNDLGY